MLYRRAVSLVTPLLLMIPIVIPLTVLLLYWYWRLTVFIIAGYCRRLNDLTDAL